jgi:opacity protein-like surface antigen
LQQWVGAPGHRRKATLKKEPTNMFLRKSPVLGALAFLMLLPAPARADWILSPFLGTTLGSELTDSEDPDDEFAKKLNYGATLTYMGGGIIGFEIDFGYAPEFFEPNDDDFDLIDESNLTTLMVNLVLGAPIGGQTGPGIRPYASGGVGLIRSHSESVGDVFDVDSNSFGLDVGGGVMGFFSDNFGVKGDLRFFRSLTDLSDDDIDVDLGTFRFWRASMGAVIRF